MPVDKQFFAGDAPCDAPREQLSAYLDGELTEIERAAVEQHLAACPDCAKLYASLRVLHDEIERAQLDPPPELHARIMARVRRENRLRKLRRWTAAASVGLAAMFCFVLIGGEITRMNRVDHHVANGAAENLYTIEENAAEDGLFRSFQPDMTGAAYDTTLEAALSFTGTGLNADDLTPTEADAVPEQNEVKADEFGAEKTNGILETESSSSDTLPPAAEVVSVLLPETQRDPARLMRNSAIASLGVGEFAQETAADSKPVEIDPFADMLQDPDARLAEEQLGTLCVVAFPGEDGATPRYAVYDLTTGAHLSLDAFLGSPDAVTALGADADTAYRPTAAGLCLFLPAGETIIDWNANDALKACVTRYAMTEYPLCAPQ